MSWALEAKGFGRSRDRTLATDLRMRAGDWLALAAAVALFAAAVWMRVMGVGVLPARILDLG